MRSIARGTSGGSSSAVATEANAVRAFRSPASQYVGVHSVHTSMKWVTPHAMMNRPKARNIQLNGMSRMRLTRYASVTEIAT